jgi:predicted N-acetyltransferase YhbS
METALAAIGARPVTLIGDAAYYRRWGFRSEATAAWRLPGPVDRARLLLRSSNHAPWNAAASVGFGHRVSRCAA